jgi:hypothetical protein
MIKILRAGRETKELKDGENLRKERDENNEQF